MRTTLALSLFIGLLGVIFVHSDENNFFFHRNEDLVMKMRINIGLLGFDGTGGFNYVIDPQKFKSFLGATLPFHQPYCIETEDPINVKYSFQYAVTRLDVSTYEHLMSQIIPNSPVKTLNNTILYQVDASSTDINNYFQSLVEIMTNKKRGNKLSEYWIFIVNPSKDKILSQVRTPQARYSLNYGSSIPGKNFVSSDRYLVVDMAAGPAPFGGLGAHETSVTSHNIPNWNPSEREVVKIFHHVETSLVAIIISAIRNILVPDIEFSSIPHADKVLIPIVVLRNHDLFHPLRQAAFNEYSIDVDHIRREVKKMFLPNQEVAIVTGMHSLHDHKTLSLVVAKARRTDMIHYATEDFTFDVKERPFLDSSMLFHEMKKVEDLLGSGLFALSMHHRATFFNPNLPDGLSTDEKDSHKPTTSGATTSAGGSTSNTKSQGTRILPVYVLSLIGHEENLLLDRTPEAVVVLQTNWSSIRTRHFSMDEPIYLDARNPTRHIIAGIAKAFGGLVEPYRRYSPVHGQVTRDNLWSLGAHPFGHYTNNTEFSQIFLDHILRNSILGRIDNSIGIIKEAIEEDYLFNPFAQSVSHASQSESWQNWIDELYHNPSFQEMSPIATETVYQLHQELQRLEKQFTTVGNLLFEYNLEEAYSMTAPFELFANGFKAYVRSEIEEAEASLMCCSLKTMVTEPSHFSTYLLICITAMLTFVAINYFIRPYQGRKKKAKM